MNRLKEIRKNKGLTQTQVAKYIGINQNTYSYWESGRNKIDNESLQRLADYFSVSVDYLLGRTDVPTSPRFTVPDKPIELDNVVGLGEFVSINVVANIHAGYDGAAIVDIEENISIPKMMLKGYAPDECAAFVVRGNSMYPLYMEGDYLIVHKQTSVDSGDNAVIIYNGDEATVKKLRYVSGEDWLEMIPINPEYMTKRIEGADLQICIVFGKVISMMRL